MIVQGKQVISSISVNAASGVPPCGYAKAELEKYLTPFLDGGDKTLCVSLALDKNAEDDEFTLSVADEVCISGGKRGVIYGVYEWLERLGFRFFAPGLERVPNGPLVLFECCAHQNPQIKFRDVLDITASNREWSIKNRLNSNLWGVRGLKEEHGGGYEFADIPAHSLTGEYLLKPFIHTHPEYFSLVGGKRYTGRDGQACATSHECAEAAAEEIKKLFRSSPAQYAALSQGDNRNFCECERCLAAYKKKGRTRVYFEFINEIASRVKREFPARKLVTLAYEDTGGALDGFQFESNITVQYCTAFCRAHAATDGTCRHNGRAAADMKRWAASARSTWIWDYVNDFRYELLLLPQYDKILENMRFYADNKAEGVFNECAHKYSDVGFAGVRAYYSYMLAKAMWNPYMTKEEWNGHRTEFLNAYFGGAAQFIEGYFSLLCAYLSERHFSYNFTAPHAFSDVTPVPPQNGERFRAFIEKGFSLLKSACGTVPERAREEVEKLYTAHLYHELFFTMEDVLARGSAAQKAEVLVKNGELIARIIKYNMKLTFWGESVETQNGELKDCSDVPPSRWNYNW